MKNVGIVVYSQSGNTMAVAQKLQERLAAAGCNAAVERVTVKGGASPGSKEIKLDSSPSVEKYDTIIFGAPVQAFSLAVPMKTYLQQLPSLQGKKVACFVTKQLPFSWTGGTRAVNEMKQICSSKGAATCGSAIVVWAKSQREQSIKKCVEDLANLAQ